MFIDEATITIKGGHGGEGKVSFYPPPMRGPDGGNGGKGGDVYILTTSYLSALKKFTHHKQISAENGFPGGKNKKTGKDGKDLFILLPTGSFIKDLLTDQSFELENVKEPILIAKGGLGGKGNFEFRSARNTTPKIAQVGLVGEEKTLNISLKLIAEFGIIGLPNSGKSSLLNELTHTLAKVGDYPFTTLEPNLGVFEGKVIADIPGLIEGASAGKGLGIKFLKHIEKVNLLLHCISADSGSFEKDYQIVMDEMTKFNPILKNKKQLILITKSDLISSSDLKEKIQALKKYKKKIIPVSIYDFDSLDKLKENLKGY